MTKKVVISKKPSKTEAADNFVSGKDAPIKDKEKPTVDILTKRITVEVSDNMHRMIKSKCASMGVKMGAKVKSLLVKEFGNG